jgi:hypothetical protein
MVRSFFWPGERRGILWKKIWMHVVKPTVMERGGTIHGQATPRKTTKGGDAVAEVHFYDLWSVDCGRLGHPQDAALKKSAKAVGRFLNLTGD